MTVIIGPSGWPKSGGRLVLSLEDFSLPASFRYEPDITVPGQTTPTHSQVSIGFLCFRVIFFWRKG